MSAKKRTAITPNKITRQVSLFTRFYEQITDDTWHMGEFFDFTDGTSGDIAVTTSGSLTAKHGQMFDYILSLAVAQRKGSDLPQYVKFNLADLVTEMGKTNSWNERQRVYFMIQHLHNFTIYMKKRSKRWMFHIISGVKADLDTGEIRIGIGNDFKEFFHFGVERYINIGNTLLLKSGETHEFAKFLQTNGQGVDKNGNPKPVNEFNYEDVCKYMGWIEEDRNKNIATVGRFLKRLKEVGYPQYRRKKVKESYIWKKQF